MKTKVATTERKARARKIIARLKREYPDATCALHHSNALELVVATILSAQCTDARVNMVTPHLFAKYRTARDYASADPRVLEKEIQSTGFYRNKTKSIIGMAQALVERHGGEVPQTMDELTALPGVGRKTANVILGTWFGKNEGIVVDTHVHRLSRLLGLTRQDDPVKIEQDLMEIVPRDDWTWFSHTLIQHGRAVCIRSCSIFTGSSCRVSPSNQLRRWTCVSTTIPSFFPNQVPRMTFAVLRPTPGRAVSSSIVCGTSPPCRSTSACAIPMIDLVLFRKKPVDWISFSRTFGSAAA